MKNHSNNDVFVHPEFADTRTIEEMRQEVSSLCLDLINLSNSGANEKVISISREIILKLRTIYGQDGVTSESGIRSSGFKKTMKKKLFRKLGGCCACGGGTIGGMRHDPILELHHIIPRSYGGDDSSSNALLVCRYCHTKIHT